MALPIRQDKDPKKKPEPLGRRIRDIINPALEDTRRQDLQLQLLDEVFEAAAMQLPSEMEKAFKQFEYKISFEPEDTRNLTVIDAITTGGKRGYSPIGTFGLPLSATFLDVTANDLKKLDGYIKLHEVARDMDVAIKLVGLTGDDKGQPALIISGHIEYHMGALEQPGLYPDLPPLEKPDNTGFDKRNGSQFRLK